MTRTISSRITAATLAAIIMLGAWLPTLTVPTEAQSSATPVAVELA